MAMSDKDLQRWSTRLQESHDLWKNHGMTSDSRNHALSPFTFIEAYRGNQWGQFGWAGLRPEDLITVNVIFANTNQMMARLSKRNPQAVVLPTSGGEETFRQARVMQVLLQYYIHELRMKYEIDRALLDALLTPFGIVRHGFTPVEEKFDSEGNLLTLHESSKAGVPWVRRVPFWDFRCDPLASSFRPDGDARWCAFRELVPKEDVKEHPLLIDRKDLHPTVSRDRREIDEKKQGGHDLGVDYDEFVEIWWIWDKKNKKRFALSDGASRPIMEPEDWPIDYEGLPFDILMFNEQPDSNIPVPFPSGYWEQQVELNKTRTLMSQLVKSMRRILIFNRNAFEGDDNTIKRLEAGELGLQEVQFLTGELANSFDQAQIGGFPSDLLGYDATIKNDIRETIGLSNMDRAQRINVETATEAGGVRQGAEIMAGRNEEKFEIFWADVLRHYAQALQQVPDFERTVQITNEADARVLGESGFFNATSEDIQGEFDFRVRAKSTLPEDEDLKFVKLLQVFQTAAPSGQIDLRPVMASLMELAGFDSNEYLLTPEQAQATLQALDGRGALDGQESTGGGGVDAGLVRSLSTRGGG